MSNSQKIRRYGKKVKVWRDAKGKFTRAPPPRPKPARATIVKALCWISALFLFAMTFNEWRLIYLDRDISHFLVALFYGSIGMILLGIGNSLGRYTKPKTKKPMIVIPVKKGHPYTIIYQSNGKNVTITRKGETIKVGPNGITEETTAEETETEEEEQQETTQERTPWERRGDEEARYYEDLDEDWT